mgnify:CR=1 FL=1
MSAPTIAEPTPAERVRTIAAVPHAAVLAADDAAEPAAAAVTASTVTVAPAGMAQVEALQELLKPLAVLGEVDGRRAGCVELWPPPITVGACPTVRRGVGAVRG